MNFHHYSKKLRFDEDAENFDSNNFDYDDDDEDFDENVHIKKIQIRWKLLKLGVMLAKLWIYAVLIYKYCHQILN